MSLISNLSAVLLLENFKHNWCLGRTLNWTQTDFISIFTLDVLNPSGNMTLLICLIKVISYIMSSPTFYLTKFRTLWGWATQKKPPQFQLHAPTKMWLLEIRILLLVAGQSANLPLKKTVNCITWILKKVFVLLQISMQNICKLTNNANKVTGKNCICNSVRRKTVEDERNLLAENKSLIKKIAPVHFLSHFSHHSLQQSDNRMELAEANVLAKTHLKIQFEPKKLRERIKKKML